MSRAMPIDREPGQTSASSDLGEPFERFRAVSSDLGELSRAVEPRGALRPFGKLRVYRLRAEQ